MIAGEKTDVFLSEDIYATTAVETAYFNIWKGGTKVYTGKAEMHPDGGIIKVYLNRYARRIIEAGVLPADTGLTSNPDGVAQLTVEFEDEDGNEIETSSPVRVWYGAGVFDQTGKVFTTEVINGHASPQMLLFLSHDARYSFNITI